MKWLAGKKTYICAVLMAVSTGLLTYGFINQEQYAAIQGVLAAFGLAALRAGVSKAIPVPPAAPAKEGQ